MGGGKLDKEKIDEDSDKISHIIKEIRRIKEEFDNETEKKIMKYEKMFPEMVSKFQESKKWTNEHKRRKISLDILIKMMKLRREKYNE